MAIQPRRPKAASWPRRQAAIQPGQPRQPRRPGGQVARQHRRRGSQPALRQWGHGERWGRGEPQSRTRSGAARRSAECTASQAATIENPSIFDLRSRRSQNLFYLLSCIFYSGCPRVAAFDYPGCPGRLAAPDCEAARNIMLTCTLYYILTPTLL